MNKKIRDITASGEIAVTCYRCNHVDTLEAFSKTPIGGDLGKREYQCPSCKLAIRQEKGKDFDIQLKPIISKL